MQRIVWKIEIQPFMYSEAAIKKPDRNCTASLWEEVIA